jgi:branched-chain amino acid transport system permease protein
MDVLNALVAFLNFVFVPGLAYACQLALGALGVTLIFGVLRFSSFAHGDTMAFGTVWTILLTWWFTSLGISAGPLPTALLALPFAVAVTAALLLGTDRFGWRSGILRTAPASYSTRRPSRPQPA